MRLPRGTVTLLFTDIEGSTRLLQELGPERYVLALEQHRRLLREAFAAHGGVEVEMQGDSFHFAFTHARDAAVAAAEAQRALSGHSWEAAPIRVRIGIHTGAPLVTGNLYAGLDVHQAARVMSAGHGGQVLVSETTQRLVDGELPPGLGLRDLGEHRLKDLSAPQRLYQLVVDGLESDFPPLASLHQTNLPVPVTPFLGRVRELAEVSALLARADVRLLTLTGPGGTGKTRLAAQVAAELSARYPHGVWWVLLAPLRDPGLVLETAERVLGARTGLVDHIADKPMLLLLDNFEQVVDAAADVAGVLASCPNLNLLVTSREPLHVAGEHEYPVPPLAREEAPDFFLARARAVKPDFQASELVSKICRRLDDLPLALELAAARVRVLSPGQILARLEERLPLLTGGPRDLPERQRTLRSTIAWSYELLTPDEQRLFARLAVFSGGCTLEAAEAVAGAELDTLQSLVEKNLLRHTDDRFWMLETIREYASERLPDRDDAELRRSHAEYFLDVAEQAHAAWAGPDGVAAGDRLSVELENLRAALRLAVVHPYPRLALQLAHRLYFFWSERGHSREGLEWLVAADALADGEEPALRAPGLTSAGALALDRDEPELARRLWERALTFTADPVWTARLTSNLASIDVLDGKFDVAIEKLVDTASFFRQSEDRVNLVLALGNAALAAHARGAPADAMAFARDALTVCSELEHENLTAWVLSLVGPIQLTLGDDAQAEASLTEALTLFKHHQDPAGIVDCLEGHAIVAVRRGDSGRAARLFGAVTAVRRHYDLKAQSFVEAQLAPFVSELRADADVGAVDEAWREGEAMSPDDAVAFALRR